MPSVSARAASRRSSEKKDLLVEQPRQLVVREQAVNLALELAVDVVEQVEAQELLADGQLVAVLKVVVGDGLAVEERAVGRAEVGDAVARLARLRVALDA